MGKIYYIMGKSATGKDTIYRKLREALPQLKAIIPYTTRPIRAGEKPGVEYFFSTESELEAIRVSGKLIELRTYRTVMGPWKYFTVDDGRFHAGGDQDFLMIGTLESYEKTAKYYGPGALAPIYLEAPDKVRLLRSIEREASQENPNYREVCRRYLGDEDDFSEENLRRLGIGKRYENLDLESCLGEILADISADGS